MASHSSKTTIDHDEIRQWAEGRGGRPVTVRGTGDKDEPGVLRIDFPGGAGEERFEEIAWDDWFHKFDEGGLAFLYQEHKADGAESTFFKLINRTSDEPMPKHKPSSQQSSKAKREGDNHEHDDLTHLSKAELDARAKELGIPGRSSMKKQELIDAIGEHEGKAKEKGK